MNITKAKEIKIEHVNLGKNATGPFEVNLNGEPFPADSALIAVAFPNPSGGLSMAYFSTPEVEFVRRDLQVSLHAEVAPGTHLIKPWSVFAEYMYITREPHSDVRWKKSYYASEGFIKLNASNIENQTMSGSFELVFDVENQRHVIDGHFNLKA